LKGIGDEAAGARGKMCPKDPPSTKTPFCLSIEVQIPRAGRKEEWLAMHMKFAGSNSLLKDQSYFAGPSLAEIMQMREMAPTFGHSLQMKINNQRRHLIIV
jgi:hypothetical protein